MKFIQNLSPYEVVQNGVTSRHAVTDAAPNPPCDGAPRLMVGRYPAYGVVTDEVLMVLTVRPDLGITDPRSIC